MHCPRQTPETRNLYFIGCPTFQNTIMRIAGSAASSKPKPLLVITPLCQPSLDSSALLFSIARPTCDKSSRRPPAKLSAICIVLVSAARPHKCQSSHNIQLRAFLTILPCPQKEVRSRHRVGVLHGEPFKDPSPSIPHVDSTTKLRQYHVSLKHCKQHGKTATDVLQPMSGSQFSLGNPPNERCMKQKIHFAACLAPAYIR